MIRPEAVLFDFGGTLDADGLAWNERAYRLFRGEGVSTTRAEFDAAFHRADDALVGTVAATLSLDDTVVHLFRGVAEALRPPVPVRTADRLATRFLARSRAQLRRNAILLRRLARRYRLGLVSNFYGNLATVCEDAGLRASLAALVDSAVVGCRKPDPAIFRAALSGLGVEPAAALFVGDSLPRDMAGARAIGMPHVWLRPLPAPTSGGGSGSGPGPCCPGDRVISALDELEPLLP